MDPKQMAKQIIAFNKTAFDNSFDSMTVLQGQAEKMMAAWMELNPLLPAEGRKAINEWLKAYRQGCADCKSAIDETYNRVEEFFGDFAKEKKG